MPVARFQLPDGRIGRFEVPEGTTPEQAQAMIEREYPNLAGAGAPKGEFNDLERQVLGLPPKRTEEQEFKRQLGLTARYGVEGVAALPNMVGDVLGLRSTEAVSGLLTRLGLPKPETAQERVVGDVTRAMAGQGGVAKVAQGVAAVARPATAARNVGEVLAARQGAQVLGAAGGAGAAGATREAGGGTVAQLAAGLAGGLVAPVAGDVLLQGAKATGRAAVAAARPFTESGREEVVGATLRRLASDPDAAVHRMETAPEYVPGSTPTTAQAARDPGLLTAERALRSGASGGRFAEQAGKANQARNILLSGMAGDDATLKAAEAARSTSTTATREAAFKGAAAADPAPIVGRIDSILAAPEGKQQTVAKALKDFRAQLDGETNPERLYAVRKDINLALAGKLSGERQDYKLASAQLIEVKRSIDEAIERAAPGFRQYLQDYAAQSKPINQMEALQDIRGRVLNAGTDAATGERIMSASKFYQVVTKNEAELAKVLTPEQMGKLRSIAQDLDRGALSDTAGRAAGSNTYQNVSTAYVLGQALGGKQATSPILQNLLRPLAWLNKLNESALQELLTDAMLDPAIARSLIARASPRSVESVALELLERSRALTAGATLGTAQAVSPSNAGRRSERSAGATAR